MNASEAFAVARKLHLSPEQADRLIRAAKPDSRADREARVRRIKSNIEAYPGTSYCFPEDK